ncbi:hypothetical protein GWP57_08145 [Gammaproteobacteria bacterium]|jgi:hypothetical protein|nr:hypothetical protein [Gammaproteobacteria bacterium]
MKNLTRYCLGLIAVISTSLSYAEAPPPEFIQFSPSATMGALYRPDPDKFPKPTVATLAMHRDSNFMSHITTREMPKRGIVALGMNPRCQNNEALCTPWENNALDVKQGVAYLRNLPGIETVILIGHSGGGPTMAFYQAIAENGTGLCQKPERLVKCPDTIADLPPADGVIFWDAHLGNGINALRSLNPAVMNDEEILNNNAAPKIDPRLDPFNAMNDYNSKGESAYSDEFKNTYFEAQSQRMNKLIDIALERMAQIEAGTYKYADDDAFVVPRADISRLMRLDRSIDGSTVKPHKLIKNDGTIEDCCPVPSVRPIDIDPEGNELFSEGTRFLSLRSFLSVRAIRSRNSMDDIDYCSSNNSTLCMVQHISVPVLVTAMTGHYFVRNSERIYDMTASKDKDFVAVEGATHGGNPCTACMPDGEAYDGRYDNAVRNDFDYVAGWINERF